MCSKDLIGLVFGKITVLSYSHTAKNTNYWHCKCDCGTVKTINGSSLYYEHTQSCGCLAITLKTKHGKSKTKTYQIWEAMIQRCTNPKDKAYKNYGGRGITVCDRWRTSYLDFLNDVGEKPLNHSLDRVNNDLGYFPGNVQWSTRSQQNYNRRKLRGTSLYRGVHWEKRTNKWIATFCVNRINKFIGRFPDEITAAKARDAKIIELGLPSQLNFP